MKLSVYSSSFLTHLECSECARVYDSGKLQTYCHECDAPLLARYDNESIRSKVSRDDISSQPRGIWRWSALLPVSDPSHQTSLGEGDSPLLALNRLGNLLGISNLYLKDESCNPTGTFKARGLAVAVSSAIELGVEHFVIPTAGNAGGALAAYCARAGVDAEIIMPSDAPEINQLEVRATGANLILVDGLINDAGRLSAELAEKNGWFDVSSFKEPYRVEGKKTMGLELAEHFEWHLPDVIIYPTGGGTGLIGMWKAFEELESLGWIGTHRPRMVVVQTTGCAPVVRAYETGAEDTELWANAQTSASGLRVPQPFAGRLILRTLRESNGTALAVSEEEIAAAQKQLAHNEGVLPAPEGAATLASLPHLLKSGWLNPDESVILFNTGAGLKYI
ncbi:MAG: threonine synthase [Chloroflexi bacterium]|nr:threonine synthase [Chloroflexota bacterium]